MNGDRVVVWIGKIRKLMPILVWIGFAAKLKFTFFGVYKRNHPHKAGEIYHIQ